MAAVSSVRALPARTSAANRILRTRLCFGLLLLATAAALQGQNLPVLKTAWAAHELTTAEAARAYPVQFTASVTYYDPYIDRRHPALFVCDATGCIFVVLPSFPERPLAAGDLVEVTGVSGAGDFAPIVDRGRVHPIGKGQLPAAAPLMSLTRLATGKEDGKWVEIEGVVRSVNELHRDIYLDIELTDGAIAATTVAVPGVDYTGLIDAKIRLRGNAAPMFNHRHQQGSLRLIGVSVKVFAKQIGP